MKIVFDFEGSLDKHPEIGVLMHELTRSGHHTIVLFTDPKSDINELLLSANLRPGSYFQTAEVRGGYVAKAYFCRDHEVDLIIDNEMNKIVEIGALSPKTVRLFVHDS